MNSADPQNHSEWRGRLRERLVKNLTLIKRKTGYKMDMMMMIMMMKKNASVMGLILLPFLQDIANKCMLIIFVFC